MMSTKLGEIRASGMGQKGKWLRSHGLGENIRYMCTWKRTCL